MKESGIVGGPERRRSEKTSLFGLLSFRPRVAVVAIFLTLTVAVVTLRIWQDSGSRRVDLLAREAVRVFAVAQKEGMTSPVRDPGDAESRIREWTGASLILPRESDEFAYGTVSRERVGRRAAAALRLTFEGDLYVLLIVRQEALRPGRGGSLFTEGGFISGEKDGKSFVFWERDGISYFLVSEAELTRAFDLVRRYLT